MLELVSQRLYSGTRLDYSLSLIWWPDQAHYRSGKSPVQMACCLSTYRHGSRKLVAMSYSPFWTVC
jgi:hypothetical protein